MDPVTLKWITAIHVCAIVAWVGALVGLTFLLRQHAKAAEAARADFLSLEKRVAMIADIGATIAIIAGTVILIRVPIILTGAAWMHPKLALVAVLLGLHGFQRMRLGKYKRGNVTPDPSWLAPVLEISVLAIIVLAVAKPF